MLEEISCFSSSFSFLALLWLHLSYFFAQQGCFYFGDPRTSFCVLQVLPLLTIQKGHSDSFQRVSRSARNLFLEEGGPEVCFVGMSALISQECQQVSREYSPQFLGIASAGLRAYLYQVSRRNTSHGWGTRNECPETGSLDYRIIFLAWILWDTKIIFCITLTLKFNTLKKTEDWKKKHWNAPTMLQFNAEIVENLS